MVIQVALEQAPEFTAASSMPELNQALFYILGFDTMQDVIDLHRAVARGESTEDYGIEVCFPSVHDPSNVPEGRHTAYIAQAVPYRLNGNAENWYPYKFRKEQAKKRMALMGRYAPNMNEDTVLWHYVTTPIDIGNKFANMVEKRGQANYC